MNKRAPLIAGAGVVLVCLLAIFILVLPKIGQVGEARDELQTAQDAEISLKAQLSSLQDAQAAAPETEAEIARVEDQVPPTADLPALFRLLQGAADQAAVDFFAFSPGSPAPDPTGAYSVISSQITVTGGYFAIDEFLFLMETLPRAARVTSIALTPVSAAADGTEATTTSASPSSLQLQLTIEFFTTDSSAGPGSIPGPTEGLVTAPAGEPAPEGTEPTETEPGA